MREQDNVRARPDHAGAPGRRLFRCARRGAAAHSRAVLRPHSAPVLAICQLTMCCCIAKPLPPEEHDPRSAACCSAAWRGFPILLFLNYSSPSCCLQALQIVAWRVGRTCRTTVCEAGNLMRAPGWQHNTEMMAFELLVHRVRMPQQLRMLARQTWGSGCVAGQAVLITITQGVAHLLQVGGSGQPVHGRKECQRPSRCSAPRAYCWRHCNLARRQSDVLVDFVCAGRCRALRLSIRMSGEHACKLSMHGRPCQPWAPPISDLTRPVSMCAGGRRAAVHEQDDIQQADSRAAHPPLAIPQALLAAQAGGRGGGGAGAPWRS